MTNSLKYGRGMKYYTMKTVQPIRDEKKIEAMKKILKGKSLRDYAFFTLGINTGLRVLVQKLQHNCN